LYSLTDGIIVVVVADADFVVIPAICGVQEVEAAVVVVVAVVVTISVVRVVW